MKLLKLFLFTFSCLVYNVVALADKPTVNALAFWGFLDNPKITQLIQDKCNVKFSHDTYWTNSEFLSTYKQRSSEYDIMILSNLIYGSVKDQLPRFNSNLWKTSENYYPYIKNYYLSHNYGKNTAFFTHAMVGFLYNPKNIKITSDQNIFDIFRNAKHNDVVLVDDSGEIGNMLTEAYRKKYKIRTQTKLTYDNLRRLTQDSNIYITSDFGKVFDNPKFAFAYVWSGDALKYIKDSKKAYKFIMPTSATSICTDIIVEMKDNPYTQCVAQALTSQEFLKYFENDTYYFSPYFKNDVNDPLYNEVYQQAKSNLSKYKMIQPVHDFNDYYDSKWSEIKVKYMELLGEKK